MTVARNIGLLVLFSSLLYPSGFCQDLKHGVVVENVASHLEGDKAGLQPGDIILRWMRADAQGAIESPFDLSGIEIEQAPRGQVILEGLRGTEQQSWIMGPGKWGITPRPQMAGPLLSIYREGKEMAQAGRLAEVAEEWKTAAGPATDPTATWFRFQAASMFGDARRWDEADKAYQEAVEAAGTTPAIRAQIFLSWGDTYRGRSDWNNAEACYQHSIAESQMLGAVRLITGKSFDALGMTSYHRGDLTKAEEYFRQALDIRQKLVPGSLSVAASFNNLGVAAQERGDLVKADERFRQALDIREKLAPDSLDVAASFNNLGLVAFRRRDLANSEEYYRRALDIKQKLIPGGPDVATTLNNLGLVAQEWGDLAKGEEYLRQALEILQKVAPGSPDVAADFDNLGTVAQDRGDLAKAEEYYQQALEIQQKTAPGSIDAASTLSNLGDVAWLRGDSAKAEKYFQQALGLKQKLAPGGLGVASNLNNLGTVAQERGDLGMAEEYHRQALDIRQKLAPGGLDVAASLKNLGEVARRRGDLEKAEEYDREALSIQLSRAPESKDAAETYNSLGDIARGRHELAHAEEYYRQALTIRGKVAPQSNEYAESLASLAGLMRRRGNRDSATQLYEQALNAFESQTKHLGGAEETRSNFRARHSNYFFDYIDLLMSDNKSDLAFHVAERWRARSLVELLVEARVDIRQGVDPGLRTREGYLQELLKGKSDRRIRLLTGEHVDEKQVAELEREIADLRAQYEDVLGRIRTTSPVYAALTQPQPMNASRVQQLLDDDTLLLEYVLGDQRSYVWAVTRNSLAGYELPSRSRIENLARQLHELLSAPHSKLTVQGKAAARTQASWKTVAAALSRMLLGPVATSIPGKELLVVSDGALEYVPFAVLPVPGNARGVPLIAEHEIVYAPSASVVAELRREATSRTPTPKAVFVLADPVFDKDDPRVQRNGRKPAHPYATGHGEIRSLPSERLTRSVADVGLARLSRLAFSRREADAIMAVTPAGQGKEAVGFEANRETATSQELAQYRIVHFATHALSDSRRPDLSGLVLSLVDREAKPQDGFLDLQGIYNLHLPAELIVLSACKTALGKEVVGEGLMGLTRGFMYAGATRVVASLWNSDDAATKELMVKFYTAMMRQGARPASALRQAQIAMAKQKRWSAPYYWAAFQLQGEWK